MKSMKRQAKLNGYRRKYRYQAKSSIVNKPSAPENIKFNVGINEVADPAAVGVVGVWGVYIDMRRMTRRDRF